MNLVILYTTHCPMCRVLKSKLEGKNIPYSEVTDVQLMLGRGITSVPMLELTDGDILSFPDAVQWVNLQEGTR